MRLIGNKRARAEALSVINSCINILCDAEQAFREAIAFVFSLSSAEQIALKRAELIERFHSLRAHQERLTSQVQAIASAIRGGRLMMNKQILYALAKAEVAKRRYFQAKTEWGAVAARFGINAPLPGPAVPR